MSLLNGTVDRFNGVSVSLAKGAFSSAAEFEPVLERSLGVWKSEGRRGIWVTVVDGFLMDVLQKHGFEMHHVNLDKTLTLTTWLEDSVSQLPRFATHLIGVGGLVFSQDQTEILVISERFESKIRWKLPGGLLDPGELSRDGVKREVFEETGVRAEVRGLLTARERTDALFGVSDIYLVFVLDATSIEIKTDEREISACKWARPADLLSDPDVYPFNRGIFEVAAKLTPATPLLELAPFTAFNGHQHVCLASAEHLRVMRSRLV